MSDRLYTQRQVRDSLVRVGGQLSLDGKTPGLGDILAAVAMVESATFANPGMANFDLQGDLDKVGQPTGYGEHYGPSVSCFQIRTIKEQTGTWTLRDIERVMFSLDNASAVAVQIANTSGLFAWTTYASEKYKAYLPEFYPPPSDKYQVISGDTFEKIDAKLNLPRGTMQKLHPEQDPRKLQIGQLLNLPYAKRTVVPGNTLTFLMRTVGWVSYTDTDVFKVASFAGLPDPNKIYVGQELRILKPGMEL